MEAQPGGPLTRGPAGGPGGLEQGGDAARDVVGVGGVAGEDLVAAVVADGEGMAAVGQCGAEGRQATTEGRRQGRAGVGAVGQGAPLEHVGQVGDRLLPGPAIGMELVGENLRELVAGPGGVGQGGPHEPQGGELGHPMVVGGAVPGWVTGEVVGVGPERLAVTARHQRRHPTGHCMAAGPQHRGAPVRLPPAVDPGVPARGGPGEQAPQPMPRPDGLGVVGPAGLPVPSEGGEQRLVDRLVGGTRGQRPGPAGGRPRRARAEGGRRPEPPPSLGPARRPPPKPPPRGEHGVATCR